jgi:hypothetical protein
MHDDFEGEGVTLGNASGDAADPRSHTRLPAAETFGERDKEGVRIS